MRGTHFGACVLVLMALLVAVTNVGCPAFPVIMGDAFDFLSLILKVYMFFVPLIVGLADLVRNVLLRQVPSTSEQPA